MKFTTPQRLCEPDAGGAPAGGGAPGADTPWYSLAVTGEGDAAKLNDPATWLDKAPAPMSKFIKDQMTAARAKTDGMIRVPGQDAKPEDIAAFQRALGVPEKADGYGITKPEKLPDGVDWDDAHIAKFGEVAHKIGLTPTQAKALSDFQLGFVGESAAAARAASEAAYANEMADLTKRFGPDINKAVSAANSLANMKGVPESLKAVIQGGAFDPSNKAGFWGADSLEFAAFVSKALGEDRGGGGVGGGQAMSVAEVRSIMSNKSHPLHQKWASGDVELHKRIEEAYKAQG